MHVTNTGSNTSRDQAPPRRPLPPVPQDTEITSQPDLNYNGGLFTNYASSQIAGSSTRRYDQPVSSGIVSLKARTERRN